jgi:hypothetical protein
MGQLFITIIGGLIVAAIASWFGFSGSTKVTIHGGHKVKKTGKWIILISVVMILSGLAWAGSGSPAQGGLDFNKPVTLYGLTLAGYGLIFFFVGKVVAWFQKL